MENKELIPINSIRHQNVTICRKNKKKLFLENAIEEGEKVLLMESGNTAEEHGNSKKVTDRGLRDKNASSEVTQ